MIRSALCVTLLSASFGCFAKDEAVKGRVIKVYPLSANEQVSASPVGTSVSKRDVYTIPETKQVKGTNKSVESEFKQVAVSGVEIRKGTVNENIIRIAKTELGIPESNVDFTYIPCDLIEKYTYTIPDSHFKNKYERLTYYASQYSFFSTFNSMTNTVTLEYRGPDVFENCRKSK